MVSSRVSALNYYVSNTTTAGSSFASGDRDKQWTINDILRQFGLAYLQKFGNQMSQDQLKAPRLARCRQPGWFGDVPLPRLQQSSPCA